MTHRLGQKGQVVIPKPIRERLRLVPGDELLVREDAGEVRISKPATADPDERRALLAGLRGALADGSPDLLAKLEAEHRREVQDDLQEMRRRGL